MNPILLPVLVPAAAGLVALLVPGRRHAAASAIGVLGALGLLGTALANVGVRGGFAVPWVSLGPVRAEFALRSDAFSSWALVLTGALALAAALYSAGWWRGRGGAPGRHFALLLLAAAGAALVLLADDLLVLVLGWETVTLSLVFLSVAGRDDAGPGAAKAWAVLGAGDVAILLGAVLLGLERAAAGSDRPWSLSGLAAAPPSAATGASAAAHVLFLLASMAKAGAMPLHSWLPAMSTTTHASVMAFLPGALDKVVGIYLLARTSLDWFVPSPQMRAVVMAVGAVTILCGVFMALVQHDLRRLLSFHAVSQVGYMLLGIGTGTVVGAMGGVFHMANNAIYKSCLFLGAGAVERETGTTDLGRLGGLARAMPVTFACMLVAALSISGIPPLNGFASKWLVYQGCVAAGEPLWLVAALFGSALTLASFVKVLHSVFWGSRPARLEPVRERGGIGIPAAMVLLAALCVALGVAAALPLEAFAGPAAGLPAGGAAALEGSGAAWGPVHGAAAGPPSALPHAVFDPVAVTLLVVAGALAALAIAYLGSMRDRRTRPVFVGGETFDPEIHRYSGPDFFADVREVPWIAWAISAGESGRLDLHDAVRRAGAPVAAFLRRAHSGLLQDYVAWCLAGTALLLGFLLRS